MYWNFLRGYFLKMQFPSPEILMYQLQWKLFHTGKCIFSPACRWLKQVILGLCIEECCLERVVWSLASIVFSGPSITPNRCFTAREMFISGLWLAGPGPFFPPPFPPLQIMVLGPQHQPCVEICYTFKMLALPTIYRIGINILIRYPGNWYEH